MEADIRQLFRTALDKIGAPADTAIKFEIPQNEDHGDLSSNVALALAKPLKRSPRDLANAILEEIRQTDSATIEGIDIAGPGFINIHFSNRYFQEQLRKILFQGSDYGRIPDNDGKSVNIEWVSANPTGLLHAGHGRNVALGAALANVLEWTGAKVVREYYFNNAGNQVKNLARSVQIRYLQQLGVEVELDDDCYHGGEIIDIARELKEKFADDKKDVPLSFFQEYGLESNFREIKLTLDRMGIRHDIYFNENSLYENGDIARIIEEFKSRGLAYEKDGALWLRLSEMGEKDDRVIVKSSGEPTYRLPDICYHMLKLSRGYDLVIDIFGADHIATAADVLAAVRALDQDTEKVKVVLHQMVTFISDGEVIKFSKRKGGNYLLTELIDDVGTDAAMFFFNMRAASSHLEFDVELAKEQSDKNPVYYLQYAHARIASILRFAEQQGIEFSATSQPLDSLIHQEELRLIKVLMRFPDVIRLCATWLAPHHLTEYLREVAAQFHKFYHDCRIVGSEEPIQSSRLALAYAAKQTLATGAAILGVTAPESM